MSRKSIITLIFISIAAVLIISAVLIIAVTSDRNGKKDKGTESIEYWAEGSAAAQSIIDYVAAVCDEGSDSYVPPEKRIAVFDVDGTLIGELFPTYFDECLMMHRLLHDDTYEAAPEDKEYAKALEHALFNGEDEPEAPRSGAQITAESFKDFTVDEYRAYIRSFMSEPVSGFEGMTYGECFYKPMTALVKYLAEHDFQVFIVSGTERIMLRELTEDTLGEWIPPYRVIGTTVALAATGQEDVSGRNYTYKEDDAVIMGGSVTFKSVKMNKVVSIVNEIGEVPLLAFGNSSGDFAMGQYTVQNGGRAYMLLCDDTERDYGDIGTAEKFRDECEKQGFITVSMKNDFTTIYGSNVVKTGFEEEAGAAA